MNHEGPVRVDVLVLGQGREALDGPGIVDEIALAVPGAVGLDSQKWAKAATIKKPEWEPLAHAVTVRVFGALAVLVEKRAGVVGEGSGLARVPTTFPALHAAVPGLAWDYEVALGDDAKHLGIAGRQSVRCQPIAARLRIQAVVLRQLGPQVGGRSRTAWLGGRSVSFAFVTQVAAA